MTSFAVQSAYAQKVKDKLKDIELTDQSDILELYRDIIEHFGVEAASIQQKDMKTSAVKLLEAIPPGLIFFPLDDCQVRWMVNKAKDRGIPLVAFGRGTRLTGLHVSTESPVIIIDFRRMNRIFEINKEEGTVYGQAGVLLDALQLELGKQNLWLPMDPAVSGSSIGGLIGSNASGYSSLKYGRMKDLVKALRVVLADGSDLWICKQSDVGLTELFCGSPGMYGMILEAKLKVIPVPQHCQTVTVSFSRVEEAALAVPSLVRKFGGQLSKCFLVDALGLQLINRQALSKLQETPSLFIQIDGITENIVYNLTQEIIASCANCQAISTCCAGEHEEKSLWLLFGHLWMTQPEASLQPICIHIKMLVSRVAELIREVRQWEADQMHPFLVYFFGNVGVGDVTIMAVLDIKDEQKRQSFEAFRDAIRTIGLRLGGSLLGGYEKPPSKWIMQELGEYEWALLQRIQGALDPQGIMNP